MRDLASQPRSDLGHFTTKTLTLPITNSHADTAMSQRSGRALVVDDNPADETFAVGLCEALGFATESCGSLAEAKAKVEAEHYDLILSDLDLNEPDEGLQLFHWSRRLGPDTRFILMSGRSNSNQTIPKDIDFIAKPLSAATLGRILSID